MPYAHLPGVELWYEDTGGGGVPVVFIHAAAGSSESWVNQVPAFTAAGLRCITYDLRGWRKSKATAEAVGTTHLSDDLESLVRHLGLDRFLLVATAYGGFGGLDYALRFPPRLRAFVLSSSQGGLEDPDYVAIRQRILPPEFQRLAIELRELGPSYRVTDPEGTRRWLEIIHEGGGETGPRQPLYTRIMLRTLESLTVPTLMVSGNADLLSPPALMRIMAARIPGCRLATIPEAGHSAYWERPTDWNRVVLEFLLQH